MQTFNLLQIYLSNNTRVCCKLCHFKGWFCVVCGTRPILIQAFPATEYIIYGLITIINILHIILTCLSTSDPEKERKVNHHLLLKYNHMYNERSHISLKLDHEKLFRYIKG